MELMTKLFRRKKGFTLVELLVVIAIIAILVTIVIIAINPQTVLRQTNDTKRRSEVNQIKTSLQLYFNDNNDYPTSANMVADPSELETTYIRQLPRETFYGYARVSTTDYVVGAELQGTPVQDDQDTFIKCGINADDSENNDVTLLRFTDGVDLVLNKGNGYVTCPD